MNISLTDKVAFFKKRFSCPDSLNKLEIKETHHSWVFLTDRYVFKLKKPVKKGDLDYSTPQKRYEHCNQEVLLNRRLAENVYLGVIPLVINAEGELQFSGEGRIIDWLVKMKRLEDKNMLDKSVKEGTVTTKEIDQAAHKLALFFKNTPPEKITYHRQKRLLLSVLQKNKTVLTDPFFHLDKSMIENFDKKLSQFLTTGKPLFHQRIVEKRIIEGHGDLRAEHICLRPEPAFIDCLEFSKDLRIVDPADDLSFLSMECDLLGIPNIGERFWDQYQLVVRDQVPEALKYFYKALRACVKARLSIQHYLEPQYQAEDKWQQQTDAYLKYAQTYLLKLKL